MIGVTTDVYEVAGPGGVVGFETLAEARLNRNGGQVRHRGSVAHVPAVFAVVGADGHELARFPYAIDAAVFTREIPGVVRMLAEGAPHIAP